ncbi:DNA-binding barrel domain superfamily [Sesbania bispinosa]|nr:DNA-binding barrel domain superfamily [Sesbania bispinosa]
MSSPILLTNQPTFGMFETKFYAYKGLINIEQKFWEKFRDQIPSEVFFTDPAGNTFPVGISLKGDRAVFKRNVDTMTRFYGLSRKHSMLCKYKGGNQFYILVGNRYGVEIKYPERRNPDVIVVSSDDYESDPEEYPGWTVTLTRPAASGSNPLVST